MTDFEHRRSFKDVTFVADDAEVVQSFEPFCSIQHHLHEMNTGRKLTKLKWQ